MVAYYICIILYIIIVDYYLFYSHYIYIILKLLYYIKFNINILMSVSNSDDGFTRSPTNSDILTSHAITRLLRAEKVHGDYFLGG